MLEKYGYCGSIMTLYYAGKGNLAEWKFPVQLEHDWDSQRETFASFSQKLLDN
jgi:hypothetical protein